MARFRAQAAGVGRAGVARAASSGCASCWRSAFMQRVDADVLATGEFEALADRIADRTLDPYAAAARCWRAGPDVDRRST